LVNGVKLNKKLKREGTLADAIAAVRAAETKAKAVQHS
jgi:hypothetical protein